MEALYVMEGSPLYLPKEPIPGRGPVLSVLCFIVFPYPKDVSVSRASENLSNTQNRFGGDVVQFAEF